MYGVLILLSPSSCCYSLAFRRFVTVRFQYLLAYFSWFILSINWVLDKHNEELRSFEVILIKDINGNPLLGDSFIYITYALFSNLPKDSIKNPRKQQAALSYIHHSTHRHTSMLKAQSGSRMHRVLRLQSVLVSCGRATYELSLLCQEPNSLLSLRYQFYWYQAAWSLCGCCSQSGYRRVPGQISLACLYGLTWLEWRTK